MTIDIVIFLLALVGGGAALLGKTISKPTFALYWVTLLIYILGSASDRRR